MTIPETRQAPAPRAPRPAAGFTLIELMVGMVLSLAVIGIVYYGFNASARITNRSMAMLSIHARMNPAIDLLARDAAGALLANEGGAVFAIDPDTGGLDGQVADLPELRHRLWYRYGVYTSGGYQTTQNGTFAYQVKNDPSAGIVNGSPARYSTTPDNLRDLFCRNWQKPNEYVPEAAVCELVFLTRLPALADDAGRFAAPAPYTWVRWVAARQKLDRGHPASYRMRLTRQVMRHADAPTETDGVYAPPGWSGLAVSMRARDVAGEIDSASLPGDDNPPDPESYDPDRYFGPPQIVFETAETDLLDEDQAPVWSLFPLTDRNVPVTLHRNAWDVSRGYWETRPAVPNPGYAGWNGNHDDMDSIDVPATDNQKGMKQAFWPSGVLETDLDLPINRLDRADAETYGDKFLRVMNPPDADPPVGQGHSYYLHRPPAGVYLHLQASDSNGKGPMIPFERVVAFGRE